MKKYFAMAAVATMFAACTNEDVTPQVDAMTGMPIVVKTNIAKPVDSRVAGMDDVNDIQGFTLNIEPTTEGGTDIFTRMLYNEYESCWEPTNFEGELVWANSEPVKVSAVCSGSIIIGGEAAYADYYFYVATDQSNIDNFKASDALYMPPTEITPSLEGIEVNFQHLYSKVQISIEAEGTVSDVIIGGTFIGRHFKCSTGEWIESYGGVEEIKAATDTEKGTYEAILVPQEVAAETFYVSFKIGESTYKWTSAEAVTLESGKHYTINLTVPAGPTGEAILLKGISIANWDSVTTPMGGEATKQ